MSKKKPGRRSVLDQQASYQVFISHATADKWIAKAICSQVEEAGASTFRDDRDIDGGDDIPDAIRREIARSTDLVVLVTPESVNRPWVLLEVGAAWMRRKDFRIVAVLCHVEFDTIPDMIKSKKAISINDFNLYLDELRSRVEATR